MQKEVMNVRHFIKLRYMVTKYLTSTSLKIEKTWTVALYILNELFTKHTNTLTNKMRATMLLPNFGEIKFLFADANLLTSSIRLDK